MNSVVYVSHDSLTEGIGMSQIRPLVKGLAGLGWNVTLISMEKKPPNLAIQMELKKAGVAWVALEFGKRGALHGFFRVFRLMRNLPNADVYHCRGDLASLSVLLCMKRNFLWDVRGLWGDQKLIIGSARDSNFMRSIFLTIEKLSARRASAVTTLAYALLPILEKRTGKLPKRKAVVPTCVDLELFSFHPTLPHRRTLLLSGVFNDYYDIEEMKNVITLLKTRLDLKVIWCRGHEADRKVLGIGEDEVHSKSQSEMPQEIVKSSIGIAICKQSGGVSLAGVMPTKVAEFLATGRPVIVSSGMGDLDQIFLENNIGVVIDPSFDYSSLCEKVEALLDDPELPNRCRKVAEEFFDMKKAINKYKSLYEIIIMDNQ